MLSSALCTFRGLTSARLLVCTAKDASEMGMTEPGRYIQCFVYVRASPDDNFYAHPLDVVVVVELQTKRVLQCWHHKANPIIPTLNSNFHTKLVDQVCCTNVAPSSSLVENSGSYRTDLF